MDINNFMMFHSTIILDLNDNLENIYNMLYPYNFNLTKLNNNRSILHGNAIINENINFIIHFYFNEKNKLTSFTLHSISRYRTETLNESFKKNEEWLNNIYGKSHKNHKNKYYDINFSKWNFDFLNIEHRVIDRFGNEEVIYFNIY